MSEIFDDLKKLSEMLANGEVTQAEYDRIKADLLSEQSEPTPPTNAMAGKPAGWYNDPSGKVSGYQAYWDGSTWTGQTRKAGTTPPVVDSAKKKSNRWIPIVLVGAVIVFAVVQIGNQLNEPSIEEVFSDIAAGLDAGSGGGNSGGGSSANDRIELEGKGDGATKTFRLSGGSYSVTTSVGNDCFYSFTLSNPSDGSREESITSMSDVGSTTVSLHGIEAGNYYVEVITGPAPSCPWTQTFVSS